MLYTEKILKLRRNPNREVCLFVTLPQQNAPSHPPTPLLHPHRYDDFTTSPVQCTSSVQHSNHVAIAPYFRIFGGGEVLMAGSSQETTTRQYPQRDRTLRHAKAWRPAITRPACLADHLARLIPAFCLLSLVASMGRKNSDRRGSCHLFIRDH